MTYLDRHSTVYIEVFYRVHRIRFYSVSIGLQTTCLVLSLLSSSVKSIGPVHENRPGMGQPGKKFEAINV